MQYNLLKLRKYDRRMSQADVAKYLGIATHTYNQKELGNREFTQDEMFKLAKLFGKPIDDIFLPR
ncbi:hypothetical protein ME783_10060 [Lactobacillus delbrueckii]|uniref:HTH cro/C1-type domain-containing protein n=1 Tax=Lactobacillus delbrueckii TaxID=1584 RepID=A0ABD0AES6_9LACO|nr:helix-turn-helix transcriptional regulator [Lactobacillus delbrueckii]GHN18464.1 hypothetical protein ME783_10060 [Lactobacillus delbrueckii]GHN33583.1 hypothetical protein ME791_07350 [Lactobacillus delbrueckii]